MGKEKALAETLEKSVGYPGSGQYEGRETEKGESEESGGGSNLHTKWVRKNEKP